LARLVTDIAGMVNVVALMIQPHEVIPAVAAT